MFWTNMFQLTSSVFIKQNIIDILISTDEQDYKGLEAYFEKEQKYYQEKHNPNDI